MHRPLCLAMVRALVKPLFAPLPALRRIALALALVALGACATPSPAPAPAPAPAAASLKLAPGEWPQARSDIAPDPDIRFGALPNGLRYAIRRQTIPPGQAALRLRFDAGSLMEADDQQGLAHFLEHMAFNGSKAVPEGEMVRILERLGLAFGADTNASTGLDETIFRLDLPKTDAETLDTSLMLLREAAGNLAIEPAAVDRERGVVLSEERARDTPSYRVSVARMEFLLRGQLPPRRLPIGKPEVLKSAPASRIADFYRAWWRPERAVLVAVGDFDVGEMEARIRARFGDWRAEAPVGSEPDLGPIAERRPEAKLVVEPGVREQLQIVWIGPPDERPDTLAERRRKIVERLGFSVLNRRLSAIGRSADPPFISAGAVKGDEYDAAELTLINFTPRPGRWREALTAIEQEQRRAVLHGVRQDELDREIEESLTSLRAAVAGAATRRPAGLAADILNSLFDDTVVTAPHQELAIFETAVKDLKAQEVSAALRGAFAGRGPLIFAASPTPIEGGERALLAALEASRKVAVAPPAAPRQVAWPYEHFGEPGRLAERRDDAELGAIFARFENGVRLTLKRTEFRDEEVLVRVNIGQGLLALPKDRPSLTWAAPSAIIEGGLAKIDAEDMERVLASKVYGARFGVGEEAFALTGSTRPQNLDIQLQVLAAYVVEPGWRPQAFERVKASMSDVHDRLEATVNGVVSRDLGGLLHAGDPRWTYPSRQEIDAARLEAVRAQIEPALQSGDLEVVIVGDIDPEAAIAAMGRTFGALPPRPAPASAPEPQRQVGFPAPVAEPVVRTHKGRADQAMGYVAWRTADFFADPQRARSTAVMGEVLRLRLVEELREAQGATYSPSVAYSHSYNLPGWGYVSASVEIPPARLADFFADVMRIAADLADKPVGADELARAKQPRLERLERARLTNEYWLAELSGITDDARRRTASLELIPGTRAVTAADVKAAAQQFLAEQKAWKFVVRPAGEAPPP